MNLGPGAGNKTCPAAGPAVANGCLVDAVLAGGTKSGYGFAATGLFPVTGANTSFTATAVPITYNQSDTLPIAARLSYRAPSPHNRDFPHPHLSAIPEFLCAS